VPGLWGIRRWSLLALRMKTTEARMIHAACTTARSRPGGSGRRCVTSAPRDASGASASSGGDDHAVAGGSGSTVTLSDAVTEHPRARLAPSAPDLHPKGRRLRVAPAVVAVPHGGQTSWGQSAHPCRDDGYRTVLGAAVWGVPKQSDQWNKPPSRALLGFFHCSRAACASSPQAWESPVSTARLPLVVSARNSPFASTTLGRVFAEQSGQAGGPEPRSIVAVWD
jgi:hypothetical protein